jgi:hypothetical protein
MEPAESLWRGWRKVYCVLLVVALNWVLEVGLDRIRVLGKNAKENTNRGSKPKHAGALDLQSVPLSAASRRYD